MDNPLDDLELPEPKLFSWARQYMENKNAKPARELGMLLSYVEEGFLVEELTLPAGLSSISNSHAVPYRFSVCKGKVSVYMDNSLVVLLESPYVGEIPKNTQFMLNALSSSVVQFFHPPNNMVSGNIMVEQPEVNT